MAVRPSADLLRGFSELRKMNAVLSNDTYTALTELRDATMAFYASQNQNSMDDASFWCKVVVRSFMGEVDSIGYVMRKMVLHGADTAGLSLTTRERAELMEKRYDAKTDTVLDTSDLLSPEKGIKIGFKYLARLFGSDYLLDTSGEAWRGFKRIVDVRNDLTHPKKLEHLATMNAYPALFPTVTWFYEKLSDLFRDIGARTGVVIPERRPVDAVFPPFRERDSPVQKIFSPADYELIQCDGSKSLEYVKLFFDLLSKEVDRAMDLSKESFKDMKTFRSPESQFAQRTYLRTLFANIEGHISAIKFQLEATEARGKVHLSPEEQASLSPRETTEDRLASALTLWAREFGNDRVAPREGASWVALKMARDLRNKITHPKKADELEITLKQTGTILSAHNYLVENGDALFLDEDKWVDKGGSVCEAVEQESGDAEQDDTASER